MWPGRYAVSLDDGYHGRRGIELTRLEPIDFAPGTEVVLDPDFERRSVTITVVDGEGAPAADRWVVLEPLLPDDPADRRIHSLDADGSVTVIGSWHGPRRAWLSWRPPFGPRPENAPADVRLGRIEAPGGPAPVDVRLTADPAAATAPTIDTDRGR